MNIPSSILTMLAGIVLTLISLWYGQNHSLLPEAASKEASDVDSLFNVMVTISTGLFLLVQAVLIISAIRFRRRKDDNTDGAPIHGNVPLEILWTAIPAVIILGISVYSFEIYNQMGGLDPMAAHEHGNMQIAHQMKGAAIAAPLPTSFEETAPTPPPQKQIALGIGASPEKQGKPADLLVNVTGLQYAWIFNYPESGVTSGELHLPLGKEVQLNITAPDVLHSLWLPEFRLKQDAIPGRNAELRFTANKIGEYPIVCAELCGSYHGAMRTRLIVETPEEFENWLASQKEMASKESLEEAIAINPAKMSAGEFLAPYVEKMGIDAAALAQLHSQHHHTTASN
ncbi:MAG: cytochrome c oxidase subunit II [Oscillatoriaceae bacterium SKW80]|nr:cytochrome c oxidase subunit II [Oscillatoriaceae bacterium SKYG93]MCX8121385.1 cytochrome c oxidase subunit II [Oscillatoriaceae bacterium SKW80]MDW8451938.1 cytochrome c oxidase subunit II [Oscillatoriaceae cyanobacterium SKYGB_i_bin93]HIK29481.1 cytochrome c oxidase subunit II [Oscillatoriaceae cyanobacterium M7585_C2015_266]